MHINKFKKSCQNSKLNFKKISDWRISGQGDNTEDNTLEGIYNKLYDSYRNIIIILNNNPCLKDQWEKLSEDYHYKDIITKEQNRTIKGEDRIKAWQEDISNKYDIINTSEFIEQANKCKQEGHNNCYAQLYEDKCKSLGYKSCKHKFEEIEKKEEDICKKEGFLSCKNKKEELKNKQEELCKKEGFLSCEEAGTYRYFQRFWQKYEAYVKKYDNKKIYLEKQEPFYANKNKQVLLVKNLNEEEQYPVFVKYNPKYGHRLDDKVWEWSNEFTLNLKFLAPRSSFFISFYDPNKSDIYNDKFYEETKEKIWLSSDLKTFVSSTDPTVLKFNFRAKKFDFFLEEGIRGSGSPNECWGEWSVYREGRLLCSNKRSTSYIYLKLVPEDKIPKKKDFIESLKGGGISNNIIIFLILFFIIYFWRKKLTYI